MNHEDFMAICVALGAPNRGWQKSAVDKVISLGFHISQPTVSQIYNDPNKSISPKVAQIMRALNDAIASGNISPGYSSGPVRTTVVAPNPQMIVSDPDDYLYDNEILADLKDRFETFDESIREVVCGKRQGCLVSGPPGCGKSYGVEKYRTLARGVYEPITGDISPVNLYKVLYRIKDGGCAVFDDCDGVFADEVKLNLLKGALETKKPGAPRMLSWLKESNALAAEEMEQTFDFQGRVLFMTNVDFEREIERGTKLAPHLNALTDRTGYMSLGLHSKRRRMLHIEQVAQNSTIFEDNGVTKEETKNEILDFIRAYQKSWRNLNIRLIVNLSNYRVDMPSKWQKHARRLLMRSYR